MILRINGTVYKARSPFELELGDLLTLDLESTALGYTVNLAVIEELAQAVQEITDPDPEQRKRLRGSSFAGMMLFAVQIYASRRAAGDDVTFKEAIAVKMGDVDVITEADDEDDDVLGKPKRPSDRTPKGSARAAGPRAAASKSPRKPPAKSRKGSTAASRQSPTSGRATR